MRVLETVGVWLVIIGLFAGLGFGVWLVTRDGIARIDETLAQADAARSARFSAEAVVAPGIGSPPGDEAENQSPLERLAGPRWEVHPSPTYPMSSDGVMIPGSVTLVCQATETGALTGCEIVEEAPAGHGFGAAALEAASRARLTPATLDGLPASGEVRFSIRFRPG